MAEPPPRAPDEDETVVVPPDETSVDPRWRVPPERRVRVEETSVEQPPRRRLPELWPWLLALLVLVLGGLAAAWLLTREDDDPAATTTTAARVQVPLLVGLTEERAREELLDVRLEAEVSRRAAPEPRGVVVEQEPEQGARLDEGDVVRLVVSDGRAGATTNATTTTAQPETARVPEVVGRRSSEAAAAIRDAGFEVELVPVPSNEPSGVVVGQAPAAGTEAERGSEVRLNVAQGPAQTQPATTAPPATTEPPEPSTVPDVVGQALANAAQAFADAGLRVAARYVPSEEQQGIVVAQAQPAGTERPRGSTVQVNVSTGAEPAEAASVPTVVGQPLEDARAALEDAGFEVLAVNLADEVRRTDRVASQTPGGGASIPRGSLVVLYVSR